MVVTNNKYMAVLGGGCFWCTEAVFKSIKGVLDVVPGYAGGDIASPTTEQVYTGKTGHAEVVRIEFDPQQISYEQILQVFFGTHDPTSLNRQGADIGTQYRSIILFADLEQRETAQRVIQELESQDIFAAPIVTEIKPLAEFYTAEEYHHDYFAKNPNQAYCQIIIAPKLQKFRRKFGDLL